MLRLVVVKEAIKGIKPSYGVFSLTKKNSIIQAIRGTRMNTVSGIIIPPGIEKLLQPLLALLFLVGRYSLVVISSYLYKSWLLLSTF